jgi:RNA polymerase sigma-70 factor (ECF subfamily)
MTHTGWDPTDDLLVMQAQDGDAEAMEALVRRWQRRLWTHAYRLTGRSEAAWDITQQSWLAIIKGLGRLHDPASFRAWAYRIVANKGMDYVRSQPPAATRPTPDAVERRPPRQESDAILRDLLNRLEPAKRALLVLYYLEGLTVPEIGFVLGIPPGTVKSRLHASREELKKLWRQDAAESGDERRRRQEDHRRRG